MIQKQYSIIVQPPNSDWRVGFIANFSQNSDGRSLFLESTNYGPENFTGTHYTNFTNISGLSSIKSKQDLSQLLAFKPVVTTTTTDPENKWKSAASDETYIDPEWEGRDISGVYYGGGLGLCHFTDLTIFIQEGAKFHTIQEFIDCLLQIGGGLYVADITQVDPTTTITPPTVLINTLS